jgi:hypothetical protein
MDPTTDVENRDRSASPDLHATSSLRLSPPPHDRLEIQSRSTVEDVCSDDFEGYDESGVSLSFQPDDVSSIGDSMMTAAKMEPDGYKAEEVYTFPAANHAPTRTGSSMISAGKYLKESSTLLAVPERKIHTQSSQTPNRSSMQHSKQKIEEIMNR